MPRTARRRKNHDFQSPTLKSPTFQSLFTRRFAMSLFAGIALWMAFPPVAAAPLAWIATVPWIWLANEKTRGQGNSYGLLYLAGFIHWLIMTQWIRLPHWSTGFGWIVLAAYLGAYIPLFIGLTRIGVHRLQINVVWVAPAVWTGLEVVRGFFVTGFSVALLGHSQVSWIEMIQISDLGGAYVVGTVMILVAACFVDGYSAWLERKRSPVWSLLLALSVGAGCWTYGSWRIAQNPRTGKESSEPVRIGLVQGTIDTEFGPDAVAPMKIFSDYVRISQELLSRNEDIDGIVWPESMFASALIRETPPVSAPEEFGLSDEDFWARIATNKRNFTDSARIVASLWRIPIVVCTTAIHLQGSDYQRFNSALLLDEQGQIQGRYDKMHPVMFGEYIPFGDWIPWLYSLTPLSGGLTSGKAPQVFEIAGLRFAPCICFENTIPHLIRNNVSRLSTGGTPPDALVTLTNDGWFWGSSLLDHHLACGVFRAVETRLPMLIAANTGISAWIDPAGRVLEQGPRRQEAVIVAELPKREDFAQSVYLRIGDSFGFACVAICGCLAIIGLARVIGPAS